MGEKFYYDDNIFFITEIIKNIRDGVRLDISPRLFADKIVEDILFVDSALAGLYAALTKNEMLIKRAEYLRRLMRVKLLYADLLDLIRTDELSVSDRLEPFFDKFEQIAAEKRGDAGDIRAILSNAADDIDEHTDTISQEEYRYLLMGGENSEEPA